MSTEDITLGEISRGMADLRQEIRAFRSEHVRRELYEAHRSQTEASLAVLRSEMDQRERDRATMRRQVTLAVVGAALALLTQFISIIAT